MKEKYSHLSEDEGYEYSFYNFRGTEQNVVMRNDFFAVYDLTTDHNDAIFEISTVQKENIVWNEFSLSDNEFMWYNGKYNTDLCIVIGDHEKDWEKRYITCFDHSNAEEVFELYGEEYFFQQLTVQNVISYEQFQKEVNWYYNYLLPNLLRENEMIYISNIELFDLKSLEGFKVI
jgi:hypothetical protein